MTSATTTSSAPLSATGVKTAATVFGGVFLLTLTAQFQIFGPWGPIPITGQTFGVTLLALLAGSRQSFAATATYLALSLAGIPVLAGATAFVFGTSSGYLLGMLVAAYAMGLLADQGAVRKWSSSFLTGLVGMIIIYTFGLGVLRYFVPGTVLLSAGLWPFLVGDLIKIAAAASVAHAIKGPKTSYR